MYSSVCMEGFYNTKSVGLQLAVEISESTPNCDKLFSLNQLKQAILLFNWRSLSNIIFYKIMVYVQLLEFSRGSSVFQK